MKFGILSAVCAAMARAISTSGLRPLALSLALAAPVVATPAMAGPLQCVPYARQVSGIAIRGNAKTWWDQADGVYARGNRPAKGAVLNFKGTAAMPYGHVATVSKVIDARHVLLDHANWSGPGRIERAALAVDVSAAGDWSEVKVWFAPSGGLGSRVNPAFGFIYAAPMAPMLAPAPTLARTIVLPMPGLASAGRIDGRAEG